MRSFDSIQFDTSGYTLLGNVNGPRVWHTDDGDNISLYYCSQPPDIPGDIHHLNDLRVAYRKVCTEAGGGVIEIDTPQVDDCRMVRTIFKSRQQPSGMTYRGSLTLPFRDFSYILKVQCAELETTGMREALVLDALIEAGEIDFEHADAGRIPGWMQDPYDPQATGPLLRNRSEDERYDDQFPDHPLTRLRVILNQVQSSLKIAREIKSCPPFVFKQKEEKRAWWARW